MTATHKSKSGQLANHDARKKSFSSAKHQRGKEGKDTRPGANKSGPREKGDTGTFKREKEQVPSKPREKNFKPNENKKNEDKNTKDSKKNGKDQKQPKLSKPDNSHEDEVGTGVDVDIDRVKQVSLNQKISQHASRKELQQAKELYEEALREDLANSHTFGAMVNAAVRCGEMSLAENVIATMLEKGRKLKDVVLYTTLLKGYCAQGNLTKALTLFQDMLKKLSVVQPNIRTINTLLRGCVQMGEGYVAETLLTMTQKELKIKPDVSSWEYLVTLLSQGLLVNKMLPIVGRLKGEADMQSGMSSMLVNLARAAALSGDFKLARKTLQQATTVLDSTASESITAISEALGGGRERDGDEVDEKLAATTNASKSVLGGKRAWKSQGETTLSTDERRNQSLLLYREHIREEYKQEVQTLLKFVEAQQTRIASSPARSLSTAETTLRFLSPYFSRMLSFDAHTAYTAMVSTSSIFTATPRDHAVSAQAVREQLFLAICFKFGLDSLVSQSSGFHCSELLKDEAEKGAEKKKNSTSSSSAAAPPLVDLLGRAPALSSNKALDAEKNKEFISFVSQLQSSVFAYLDDDAKLCFEKVFSSSLDDESEEKSVVDASKPIKLEVCSGAGEWAVTQAKSDPTSPWATLELRHDRVYQTATKMIYAEARNLCVLGGDAMTVLPRHFRSQSVGHLFVNHPEPPQQTGGDTSEGHHLLNETFFKEVDRVLIENGMCTIVTDNLWYGKFLCRLLSLQTSLRLRSLTAKDHTLINSTWLLQHEVENVVLWVGEPGAEAGHVVDASSYFDRLWKRGQLQERYFIVLVKSSSYVRAKPTKVPLKIPAVTAKKSIKFDDDEDDVVETVVPGKKVASKKIETTKKSNEPEESVESILNAIKELEKTDSSLTTAPDSANKEEKMTQRKAKANHSQAMKDNKKPNSPSKASRKRGSAPQRDNAKKPDVNQQKKKKRF